MPKFRVKADFEYDLEDDGDVEREKRWLDGGWLNESFTENLFVRSLHIEVVE